ncbi:MAG: helix-turn-helix transcriptional regulator [Clostridia bacterium]|nr:helix-turn-helix transcriptional regulator [Clostridia bacterium]
MIDYVAIGQRIRALRHTKNLTQADLARRAGMSVSWLSHIERGSRKLSLKTLLELCRAMSIRPSELLECDGDPRPEPMPAERASGLLLLQEAPDASE